MFKKYHIDEICPDNFLFDKEIEYEGTDKERYFNENPSKTRTRKNFFAMTSTGKNQYIDFVLEEDENFQGQFGYVQKLSNDDFNKYRELFVDLLGFNYCDIKSLCFVEHCWYDGADEPDYYVEELGWLDER
jgi:hypothetical protein